MTESAPPEAPEPKPKRRFPSLFAPENRNRVIFFAIWLAALLLILTLFRGVLMPFFLAVVMAYVMAPLVERLEQRMRRWLAVVTIYVALLGAIVAFFAVGVPRLVVEIEKLAREAPRGVAAVRDEWLPALESRLRVAMASAAEDSGDVPTPDEPAPESPGTAAEAPGDGTTPVALPEGPVTVDVSEAHAEGIRVVPMPDGGFVVRLPPSGIVIAPDGEDYRVRESEHHEGEQDVTSAVTEALRGLTENTQQTAVTVLRTAQRVAARVVRGIFTFFIVLMLSAYLLITKEQVLGFLRNLARAHQRSSFDGLMRRIDRGLSGVIRGQIIICLINGALSGIGFAALGLRYWPILTLIATVLSIIPIFGAILSTIPAVIVGLQQGVGVAVAVVVWIVVIHQIEANLLNPKIMGDAAHVHPVLVVFALLGGEHVFGIVGALLAVPVLSILQSLFLHYREEALGVPAPRRSDASQSDGAAPA